LQCNQFSYLLFLLKDLIAIPDYPYETSETWGLTIFRESSLLYSNTTDSAISHQNVALNVAQSMAQMVRFTLEVLLRESERKEYKNKFIFLLN
jgi:hypothetical protein